MSGFILKQILLPKIFLVSVWNFFLSQKLLNTFYIIQIKALETFWQSSPQQF